MVVMAGQVFFGKKVAPGNHVHPENAEKSRRYQTTGDFFGIARAGEIGAEVMKAGNPFKGAATRLHVPEVGLSERGLVPLVLQARFPELHQARRLGKWQRLNQNRSEERRVGKEGRS